MAVIFEHTKAIDRRSVGEDIAPPALIGAIAVVLVVAGLIWSSVVVGAALAALLLGGAGLARLERRPLRTAEAATLAAIHLLVLLAL